MALKKIQSSDQDLMFVQTNVETAIIPLQNAPLSGGNLIKNVSLTSGQNNPISHNLGHSPSFYLISPPNVQSTIWVTTTTNALLNISCSTSCTVSVWAS